MISQCDVIRDPNFWFSDISVLVKVNFIACWGSNSLNSQGVEEKQLLSALLLVNINLMADIPTFLLKKLYHFVSIGSKSDLNNWSLLNFLQRKFKVK